MLKLIKLNKKKMNNKNIVLTTIFLAMFVLAVLPLVNAATTIDSPVTGGNYTTTLNVSVSVDANTAHNMTNVTCFYNATGGSATSLLVIIANDSHSDLIFENASIGITGLTDLATYNISCDVRNSTTLNTTVSKATITIDSTSPVCSLVRAHSNFAWKDTQLITWSITDAVGLDTTGLTTITVDRPEDGSDMTYTDTSRALTLTSQDTKYIGDWSVSLTGTDRPGNTCTPSVTFRSYLPNGDIWEAGAPKAPVDMGKTVLLLLIIGTIVYFVFFNKKK